MSPSLAIEGPRQQPDADRLTAPRQIEHEDVRALPERRLGVTELRWQIDHGHDRAPEVHHATDGARHGRDVRDGLVLDDLPDELDVDAVLLAHQEESDELSRVPRDGHLRVLRAR
jgi:hypothetical protein